MGIQVAGESIVLRAVEFRGKDARCDLLQRCRIKVPGLRQTMCLLVVDEGRLHGESVDAIFLKGLPVDTTKAIVVQRALGSLHKIGRFADSDRAIIHDWTGLDAMRAPVGIQ